ncbi:MULTISPECIES: ATP-binding response regulator [Burkholderia cepacia complex]|uniref:histidine kinase n=1 Tax=Burkholderia pseudomultivorans TaxID=1207504 RepID=A0ABU2E1C0_9BURK|nr:MULTISPECIES: ATP-binding protein [Burkholderia cepacia complex]MDN8068989.1 ATP-binding protein [Burkholderia vietnamiensis]MDR8728264.1 Sensor protein EvgS [Burkholderia pseudomultivorans]MDR8735232.1 Sensor protein EvgS [Burkholderia pseudomultivorans]MDR8741392.1 Sensor protein EvgS [Burkholderia pseudomultivorans]MDR8753654.1 Sensor protein EvgS [Burkholderia pseudomultivorans]
MINHPAVRTESRILLAQARDVNLPGTVERHLAARGLLPVRSLEQLPQPPCEADVLLTPSSWTRELAAPQRERLSAYGRAVGAWIALTDTPVAFDENLNLLDLGVDHVLPVPTAPEQWGALIDGLRSRMPLRRAAPIPCETLGEGEARFRFFLDNVEEGVVVCANGIIVDVSDRWLELFRCPREEAIGHPVLDYTSPRAVPMARQLIEERWAETYESEMLRRDGTTFPAIVRGRDQSFGGRELRLTTILDITRQKESEQALKLAKAEAERACHAKSEFLSSMSHELRTPLNAILGFAQILEMDDGLNTDQLDSIAEILKAGHHLLGLINEVLDLASIESGKTTLSLETVDVSTLIRDCAQLVQPLATSREIDLHLEIPERAAACADNQRLKQIVLNLLSNAIKYNHPSGEVRVTVEPDGSRLRIAVADTGAGICAERLGELFQPFSRLGADHASVEGTGIGLVITRKLTEAMGGRIGVESEPGKGSRFWVELPLAQLSSQPAPLSLLANDSGVAPVTARQGEHYILYIDDNPVNLKLVTQILDKLRHIRLVTMYAPEMGIEFALSHQPDLILLDINLPDMDGYQVLEVFKSHLQLRHVPVIAVSANAMPRDIERGMAAGFADYLTKPLDIGRFLASIDAHLPGVMEKRSNDAQT